MKFEEKLLRLRKEKGLSQEGLAEKLNVSRQAVSRWESGDSTPDMDNLVSICNFFGVSSDHLILDVENREDDIQKQIKEPTPKKEKYPLHHLLSALYSLVAVCTAICGIIYTQNHFQLILSLLCCALFSVTSAVQFILFFKKLKKNQKNT